MNDAKTNPFRMPSDEEVFLRRDEEKRQKTAEREKLKNLSVQDKTTWSARIGAATSSRDVSAEERQQVSSAPANHTLPTIDVREKDNMAIYIQKKREMGLARMSLATKRQEIKKLDEEADRGEKRLRQQQEQLQNTHSKFSDFLRQSNMEQDAAVKRADTETKAKQEKMQEMKKLNGQILQIEVEKKKNDEQMEQCTEFKRFLDRLTPPTWFRDTVKALLVDDEKARQSAMLEKELADDIAEGLDDDQDEKHQQLLVQMNKRMEVATTNIDAQVNLLSPEDVRLHLDSYDSSRVPMFFSNPEQILSKFVDIEEGNLFLIQTCQELEEEIETIAQLYQREQQEMVQIAQQRKQQMDAVSNKINVERQKAGQLRERLERVRASGNQEDLKQKIEEKIKTIFRTLGGLGDESNMDALGMLTYIETRLEEMRATIKNQKHGIEESFISTIMKQRDRDRRRKARQLMLDIQIQERELRSNKALERSQKPVLKRVGKPVMWRSRPLDRKKKETVTNVEVEDEDDEFFQ